MSTKIVDNKQDKIVEEATEGKHQEVEEVEEEEVDVELQKQMKNATIDESAFTNDKTTNTKNQKVDQSGKGKKSKKTKGEDFLTYANKNGIQVNLQYEEKETQEKDTKNSYQQNNQNNQNQNQSQGQGQGQNQGKNYYNKNQSGEGKSSKQSYTYNKNEGSSSTYSGQYQNNQNSNQGEYTQNYQKGGQKNYSNNNKGTKRPFYKVGDNKFDKFNQHLPQMMSMMPPQYNPYSMQGNNFNQNQNQNQGGFYQNQNQGGNFYQQQQHSMKPTFESGITLFDATDESIVKFLEQYFGLENLNKDLYLRNRIDENGFIDCEEIANHNKLKKFGISIERLIEVLNENVEHPIIEANSTQNNRVIVRNREWDKIKDKLLTKEHIYQVKKDNKINRLEDNILWDIILI